MDSSFTKCSDGLKDGETNGSTVKEIVQGNGRHTTKDSSQKKETELTVIPMHRFSNGEDGDLEIIALHPEGGQQLGDETMTEAYLVEGRGFLLF